MKLRTKLAIVLLVVTVVLSVAITGGLELYKQQQISETRANVNETADLSAQQIGTSVQGYKDDLRRFAMEGSSPSDLDPESVETFLTNTDFWAAQVIADNGTVVYVGGGNELSEEGRENMTGSNRSTDQIVREVLDPPINTIMGDPSYSSARSIDRRTYVATIAAPIINDQGQVTGAIAAPIDLSTGTVFQSISPLEVSNRIVRIDDGGETIYETNNSFDRTISGAAAVDEQGWRVVVAQDASGLTTELRNLAIGQGVGLGVVLLFVVAFGYWEYTTNLRQTERLLTGFEEIREGNYEYSVELGSGEEWIQISDGFNDLSMGLKRREERLRERQQRLEVMYRVLRHNLRNEMSIVQNYAGIINDMSGEEPIRDAAETILDAGEDLIGLSEKARQIENALQEASTEPTTLDVAGVVSEVTGDMREEYPEVDLRTSIPDRAWAAAIPSFQLAVENVCENACKHNDADDPVVEMSVTADGDADETPAAEARAIVEADGGAEVSGSDGVDEEDEVAYTGGSVAIEVADNGPGIPEQDRNVLREGRETALEHGSGLGLWLVYWVVDKSGGVLGFDENDPRGSIVTVELDAAAPPPDPDDEDESGSPDDESTDAFA